MFKCPLFRKSLTSVTSAGKPSTAAPRSTRTRASTRDTSRSCASSAGKDSTRKVSRTHSHVYIFIIVYVYDVRDLNILLQNYLPHYYNDFIQNSVYLCYNDDNKNSNSSEIAEYNVFLFLKYI